MTTVIQASITRIPTTTAMVTIMVTTMATAMRTITGIPILTSGASPSNGRACGIGIATGWLDC